MKYHLAHIKEQDKYYIILENKDYKRIKNLGIPIEVYNTTVYGGIKGSWYSISEPYLSAIMNWNNYADLDLKEYLDKLGLLQVTRSCHI